MFQQLHQSACSPKANIAGNFLGPNLRMFNTPQNSHTKFDDEYSLLEEAHMADKSGFLRLREPSGRLGYYGVSMYHQLHCLKMLRDRIEGKDSNHSHEKREAIDDQLTPDHLIHCLDYLSQVLLPLLLNNGADFDRLSYVLLMTRLSLLGSKSFLMDIILR